MSRGNGANATRIGTWPADAGGTASRFFYCAKASKADRAGSKHPTVKPQSLMRWLCRLVTPPGGTILDCFAGSGSTGAAAMREGFNAVLIEREAEYVADIQLRIAQVEAEATTIITTAQMDMFA
jgi:site-specific DNA-methyltransferase (adenine-specific)